MSDLLQKLSDLTPERRRLLELRMRLARAAAEGGPAPRARPRDGNAAPASFAQERLWLVDRLDPGGAFYTMPYPLRIRGALDAAALERALDALRERHETLRTTFAERGGEPVQVVHPFAPVPLPVDDLTALAPGAREAEAMRRVHADANTGFDLQAGPLFRARLLRLDDDEHVLLLCLHHIVGDGWSMGVLTRELGALYEAFHDGRPSPLAPLPLQYADFAAWEREHLAGDALEARLAYWRAALAGAPPALSLPTDRPRPPRQSHRGRQRRVEIPAAVAERLRAAARAEGATLFHALLAAVRLLLARWGGDDDVVLGTPVANRGRGEVEGLIGFFVNTLPLRGDLSGDPSFAALVRRERDGALAASAHQDLPFERIVEALRVPRDPGRNPLFQAMVALLNARVDPLRLAGVRIEPLRVEYDTAKFDLLFDMTEETNGGVTVDLEYATDLFDAETVASLCDGFGALLRAAGERPEAPAFALPLLAPAERARLLALDDAPVPAGPRTVDALLAVQAERSAAAPAVHFRGETVTYGELHARANRLAHRLRALGVGPETRVGVCVERSVETVVSLLAVLKAGGAYLPLDPAYPAGRLAYMLEDAGARVALADASTARRLPDGVAAVRVDDPALAALPSTAPAPSAEPENLAWVIYTSGSTGRPKGVMIRHASAAVFVAWMRETFPLAPGERVLASTSISFDVHVAEMYFALASGAALVLVENALSLAAPGAWEGIAHAAMVPSAAAELLRMEALPPLRTLVLGGEPLSAALAAEVHATGRVGRLANGYGPTEDTTYSTVAEVAAGAARVTVGRPVGGGRAYVLDPRGEPVPVGMVGEVWLAGDGLARGYLDRPSLTAERFVPDPFSAAPGARMYWTGDRGRRLPSGELESLGRLDDQVKVRGFRIEPGEVEAALSSHPAVHRAVAVARGEDASRRLVAYVVPREGAAATPAELRAHAARLLPDPLVPTAWVILDALPLTPSGKVDRRALPDPGVAPADPRQAPRTPTEEVLAALFAEVLELPRVGRGESFFELGGHSLLAARVSSRVRAALQVELALRDVFDAPSVAALAERVDAERRRRGGEPEAPIARVDRAGELPLSFAQERLWFIARLQPDSPAYNMPFALHLDGALDAAALRRALEEIVRRHETLRTVFRQGERGPAQVILPPPSIDLAPVDLAGMEDDAREAEAARLADEEAKLPFDLAASAPVRFRLLRLGDDEHRLLLTLHHIANDGWSLDRLFGELAALYGAFTRGEPSPLVDPAVQYADFAAWQREWLRGAVLERQVAYWKTRLAGAPSLALPADRPRPPVPSQRGGLLAVPLSPDAVEGMHALARREGATPFMAYLAAFTLLLRRWSGQDDLVVGTPVAGRTRPEVEPLVGFFVNTVVLRLDASGEPTFRELLGRVRETALDAYAHQDLPFERLVDELKVERQLSRHPVFQVVFSSQRDDGVPPMGEELAVRAASGDTETTKFDLLVVAERTEAGTALLVQYARDLFEEETARRMGAYLAALLTAAAERPDAPLSALLERVDDEARRALETAPSVDGDAAEPWRPAHADFAARAAASPEAAAWVGAETRSYGEMRARAVRLARHLRALGIGPERRVGIVADGSAGALEAVLATLMAGGAFVPVDPSLSPARLRHLLGDAELSALVAATAARLVALSPVAIPVVALDRDAAAIASATGDLDAAADPAALAAVLYSSGTTSLARGVLLTHRALASAARAAAGRFQVGATSRVLHLHPLSTAAGVLEALVALVAGAALVPATRDTAAGAMRRGDATHVVATPAVLAALDAEAPLRLGTVIVTGESPSATLAARWAREGRTVHGLLSIAEAGIAVAAGAVDGAPAVGRPLGGARAYVVDDALRPLPPGVPGELCVGGDAIARGWQGRPGLTASRFVPDPFAGVPGARMARTGDRARWRPDGRLEVLGRMDARAALRAEPGQVADVLAALPGVAHAVVGVRADASGGERLAAWVTALAGVEPRPAALREALWERLEEAAVPAAIAVVDALPLSGDGKVDRRALPAPELASGAAAPSAAPRGELERAVAAVWQEVLATDAVGVGDNFFEIGGHSLLLARLQERLEAHLKREVRMVDLFRYPTVGAFAAYLGQSAEAAPQAAPKRGIDRGAARREVLLRRGR